MVINDQIENTNDGKYIGTGTGIDIALGAWMMNHGQKKMKWDGDDNGLWPESVNNKQKHLPIEESQSKYGSCCRLSPTLFITS